MEAIAKLTGDNIPSVVGPTTAAFLPLLEKRRSEIENYPVRTFKYGGTDRHQLDVYYPEPATVSGSAVPVMFFEYGGGLTIGSRKMNPPLDVLYGNVGVFFAKRGIMLVIADYRLVPEAKYPQPAEDVRDAIAWFLANPSTVLADNPAGLPADIDISRVFVNGHSAGTLHMATLYLSPSILPLDSPVRAATVGLIPAGGAFSFKPDVPGIPPATVEAYYGSIAEAQARVPQVLLEEAPDALISGLPDFFFLASEHEPSFLRDTIPLFIKALEGRLGKPVKDVVMKGHNHISPYWSLLSGEGEDWAEELAAWIKAKF